MEASHFFICRIESYSEVVSTPVNFTDPPDNLFCPRCLTNSRGVYKIEVGRLQIADIYDQPMLS